MAQRELPKLHVVVTTLAIGDVLMAGGFGDGHLIGRDAQLTRRQVYVDTMGLHPAAVDSMVELLGADRVLAGTDWPITLEKDVPGRLQKALTVAGLSAEQRQMVAGGNTLKLLGVA
jgi:predicted TIM-barrel fold metal-dependent hydrolase